MKRALASLALTMTISSPAWAQDAPAPAASPAAAAPAAPASEAPKPAPELAKLQFMVGDWVHEEIHHGGASGPVKAAARSRNAWILRDQQLYILYRSKGPRGDYEGRGMIGWDAEAKTYRLAYFDDTGFAHLYSGSFNPEDALVFNGEFTQGGDRIRQQLTIQKQEGGKFLLKDEQAIGGGAMKLVLESLAQAAPAASAPAPAAPGAAPSSAGSPAATSTPAPTAAPK